MFGKWCEEFLPGWCAGLPRQSRCRLLPSVREFSGKEDHGAATRLRNGSCFCHKSYTTHQHVLLRSLSRLLAQSIRITCVICYLQNLMLWYACARMQISFSFFKRRISSCSCLVVIIIVFHSCVFIYSGTLIFHICPNVFLNIFLPSLAANSSTLFGHFLRIILPAGLTVNKKVYSYLVNCKV